MKSPPGAKLSREFYARPTLAVARDLLGKQLVHRHQRKRLSGRIVEVEAYIGEEDQACHARFGRTPRSEMLYGPPGHAYVFLIYGMYNCFNVVTEATDAPAAVLIRAVELNEIAADGSGPGKLCRALSITRAHNGVDLTGNLLWLEEGSGRAPKIAATPRIGVDYAGAWAKRPWRLIDTTSNQLSRKLSTARE